MKDSRPEISDTYRDVSSVSEGFMSSSDMET